MKTLIMVLMILGAVGCADIDDEGQDFGNIFESPEGLILTEAEHPDGWGRDDCITCHPLSVIHQEDRSDTFLLPIDEIQDFVQEEGPDSCVICHGDNGAFE